MQRNSPAKIKITLKTKITLIIFGFFLFLILLEIGLRLGGFIFLSLQEYRNRISISKKGSYRIMCLGESTTVVGGDHSYPSQLEKVLNERNTGIKFSVINKGIIGASSSSIVTQLEGNLNKYKPDMVTVMMGANDGGEHLPYRYTTTLKTVPFLTYFRTYKLVSFLWLHIVAKLKETVIYRPKEDKGLTIPTQAEEAFKKAIELNPKDNRASIELGWSYRNQGKYSQAEEAFKKAIELNPRNDMAYLFLGWIYLEDDKRAQAEEAFEKAIELNPGNDTAYTSLGRIYRNQGKYSQAEEAFKKAIELNPRNDVAYLFLGWIYLEENNRLQAEESFKKAIELNPKNDKLYAGLAVAYKEIGRYESAQECYKKANDLRLDYYNPVTRHNYLRLKEILDKKGIKLACVQYPVCSVESLKKIFESREGIIFVDNEKVFKEALKKRSYKEYFTDIFGGDFGHCTYKGNRLLAGNIANVILKEVFGK